MDGIDGIAAAEMISVALGLAVCALAADASTGLVVFAGLLAGAAAGFLVWNWPPAKIFMGDAGSGFLGFFIATLTLASTRDSPSAIFVWIILGGVFYVDATVTLVRRLLRGARVYQPHREHAYQRLSRRWKSHRATVAAMLVANVCWLGPWAWYAATHPVSAGSACVAALAPLALIAFAVGAGRPE
jgi:Fuc2NAc and GlcNAc transferase